MSENYLVEWWRGKKIVGFHGFPQKVSPADIVAASAAEFPGVLLGDIVVIPGDDEGLTPGYSLNLMIRQDFADALSAEDPDQWKIHTIVIQPTGPLHAQRMSEEQIAAFLEGRPINKGT